MPFCTYSDCENYTEGSTNFCASHNLMFRKSKRDAKKIKVVTPVRKVSGKMAKELAVYEIKKAAHLKKFPNCQAKLIGCVNKNNTVHHIAKRGKNLNNEDTFLTVCTECHDQIEFKMSAKERREKHLLQ